MNLPLELTPWFWKLKWAIPGITRWTIFAFFHYLASSPTTTFQTTFFLSWNNLLPFLAHSIDFHLLLLILCQKRREKGMSKFCLVRKLFVALTAEFQCSSQIKRLRKTFQLQESQTSKKVQVEFFRVMPLFDSHKREADWLGRLLKKCSLVSGWWILHSESLKKCDQITFSWKNIGVLRSSYKKFCG